jgi:hypothetical protein
MIGDLQERDDRPAYVRFERRAVESKKLSMENGRSTSVDVDYALITPPYSKDCVEIKVDTWLENTRKNVKVGRTPKEHLAHWEKAYQAFQNGQEAPLNGTPIKDWSAISPAQIKNLIAMQILTVEDLAQINDQGLARIGMGGQALRQTAINWLKSAENYGEVTLKITQLEKENERLVLTNEDLLEKNRVLVTQMEALRNNSDTYIPPASEQISADDIMPDEFEQVAPPKSLSQQYEEKFGKKPHHKMKEETIRQKLEE